MRSCREITELVSKGLDKRLSLGERLAISLHVMLCSQCRNFQKQTRFMHKAAHSYFEHLRRQLDK